MKSKKAKPNLDLDMTDIDGGVKKKNTDVSLEPVQEEEKEEELDPKSYKAVVRRLHEHRKKTWIGVPVYNDQGKRVEEKHVELSDCTGQEFFDWVNYIYPIAKKLKHSPENYETKKNRETAFIRIIDKLQQFKSRPVTLD